DRRADRPAQRGAGGGGGLRGQSPGRGHPLSPGGAQRRGAVGLSLGRGAQGGAAGARGGGVSGGTGRLATVDWNAVGAELDRQGFAVLPGLLRAEECARLAGLYDGEGFRSTVVMA